MSDAFNYENTDWERQAKRVAAAFGVAVECEFALENGDRHLVRSGPSRKSVRTVEGLRLEVWFRARTVGFALLHRGTGAARPYTDISFRADGTLIFSRPTYYEYAPQMAKALFQLDLLSPVVEAALKYSPTAHQKLEWELERATWDI